MNSPKLPFSDLEKVQQVFQKIGETCEKLPELVKNPSVEALGPIDFDELEKRDKPFFKKLLIMAQIDPEIVKRVAIMRHKLNNCILLTQAEADELITVLECKGFYHTNLDLSGMEFGELNLANIFIGGDLFCNATTVRGNNYQMDAVVKGGSYQHSMQVGLINDQSNMSANFNHQIDMKIGSHNIQSGMRVDDSNQDYMIINGNNVQEGMVVSGDNSQKGMVVKGKNLK